MLDELERVRAYRAAVAEPDDAAVAAARMQLMEAIGQAAHPAAPRRHGSRPARQRERLRRLQRRRRLVLAGGLATVGIGIAGVLGLTTAATPVSALAAQMNQLAKVAASQDWTGIPGPGQYLYVESVSNEPGFTKGPGGRKCWVSLVENRQEWIATDGSGAWSDVQHGAYTSAADQATCAALHDSASNNGASEQERLGAGGLRFPVNDWRALSTDPKTLLSQIRALGGADAHPAGEFQELTELMTESDIPPVLRATVYDALALVPGVKLLGQGTDPVGQTGLEVEYSGGTAAHELFVGRTDLIFDQRTGALLFEDEFGPGAVGQAGLWTAYLQQKIVAALPDYPVAQGAQSQAPPPQLAPVPGLSEPTTTTDAATQTSAQSPA